MTEKKTARGLLNDWIGTTRAKPAIEGELARRLELDLIDDDIIEALLQIPKERGLEMERALPLQSLRLSRQLADNLKKLKNEGH